MVEIHADKYGRWYYVDEVTGRKVKVRKPNLAPSVKGAAKVAKGPARRTVEWHRAAKGLKGLRGFQGLGEDEVRDWRSTLNKSTVRAQSRARSVHSALDLETPSCVGAIANLRDMTYAQGQANALAYEHNVYSRRETEAEGTALHRVLSVCGDGNTPALGRFTHEVRSLRQRGLKQADAYLDWADRVGDNPTAEACYRGWVDYEMALEQLAQARAASGLLREMQGEIESLPPYLRKGQDYGAARVEESRLSVRSVRGLAKLLHACGGRERVAAVAERARAEPWGEWFNEGLEAAREQDVGRRRQPRSPLLEF